MIHPKSFGLNTFYIDEFIHMDRIDTVKLFWDGYTENVNIRSWISKRRENWMRNWDNTDI